MGFLDIFKVKEFKNTISEQSAEIEQLKSTISKLTADIENYKALITPEMQDAINLQKYINELNKKIITLDNTIQDKNNNIVYIENQILNKSDFLSKINQGESLEAAIQNKKDELADLSNTITVKNADLIQLEEELLVQSFGLYTPKYDFANSTQYVEKLAEIRQQQKDMIKAGTAVTGNMEWVVNDSRSEGRKMIKDTQKLLLRAFNSECDSIIEKVKYNTYETAVKRITSSYDAVTKLGKVLNIAIACQYYNLKISELNLAFEYRTKKQEEKELQKELKAQLREEAKLQKEIEQERKKKEKEQLHYENALKDILLKLNGASNEQKEAILLKKAEIEATLSDIKQSLEDIDYRVANQKAGYVYIISNIGSFGENVYKIGMTRRLDPTERVHELGDASVPFNFDIHAMIFSDNAPKLETALHKAFENRKLNMVNQRREFFNVTLDEIKEVVKNNFDKTVEFIDVADAEQYRVSEKMKIHLS